MVNVGGSWQWWYEKGLEGHWRHNRDLVCVVIVRSGYCMFWSTMHWLNHEFLDFTPLCEVVVDGSFNLVKLQNVLAEKHFLNIGLLITNMGYCLSDNIILKYEYNDLTSVFLTMLHILRITSPMIFGTVQIETLNLSVHFCLQLNFCTYFDFAICFLLIYFNVLIFFDHFCKALWTSTVYEMCYINKLPCLTVNMHTGARDTKTAKCIFTHRKNRKCYSVRQWNAQYFDNVSYMKLKNYFKKYIFYIFLSICQWLLVIQT